MKTSSANLLALAVKQVVAIVKPYLAEKVLEVLKRAPLEALNVCEVKGYGRQKSYLDQYEDSEYSALLFFPRSKYPCGSMMHGCEEIIRGIVEVARTGRMGDGKIFVIPIGVAHTVFPGQEPNHSEAE